MPWPGRSWRVSASPGRAVEAGAQRACPSLHPSTGEGAHSGKRETEDLGGAAEGDGTGLNCAAHQPGEAIFDEARSGEVFGLTGLGGFGKAGLEGVGSEGLGFVFLHQGASVAGAIVDLETLPHVDLGLRGLGQPIEDGLVADLEDPLDLEDSIRSSASVSAELATRRAGPSGLGNTSRECTSPLSTTHVRTRGRPGCLRVQSAPAIRGPDGERMASPAGSCQVGNLAWDLRASGARRLRGTRP